MKERITIQEYSSLPKNLKKLYKALPFRQGYITEYTQLEVGYREVQVEDLKAGQEGTLELLEVSIVPKNDIIEKPQKPTT